MREVNAEKLRQILKVDHNTILLDCRSSKKYLAEHIPGAINLPLDASGEDYQSIIPDKKVLIITSCDSFLCSTSSQCYEKLKKLGYENLQEFAGGIAEWKANGFNTVKIENE